MKTIILKLKSLKNYCFGFCNKNQSSILIIVAIFVAAFILFEMKDLKHEMEKRGLMYENLDLMKDNSNLNFLNTRQLLLLNKQHQHIQELEGFKKAILEGNYTQNENTKQNKPKVVGG